MKNQKNTKGILVLWVAIFVVIGLIGAGLGLYVLNSKKGIDQQELVGPVSGKSLAVPLLEQNKSGESGTALLEEVNGYIRVTLILQRYGQEAQPAHIHKGDCETLGAIEYPLTNVVKGSSVTTVNVTLDELKQKLPLIVNVHESTSRATNYVSCGQVVFE